MHESRPSPRTTAVIGAGLAGLTVARGLKDRSESVVVFEKSRGRGGRMSTRRSDRGAFDHGAQFFTARTDAFRAQVDRWLEAGLARRWAPQVLDLGEGDDWREDVQRFVGTPTMNAPVRALADGLELRVGTRVGAIVRDGDEHALMDTGGRALGSFDRVVLAVPAEQAVPLLGITPELAGRVDAVRTAPCWAVLATLDERADAEIDLVRAADGPLELCTRMASRPARATNSNWVLHSTPEWSAEHVDEDRDVVVRTMLGAARELPVPALQSEVVSASAHLWRYARTLTPLGEPCLWDADLGVGVVGDWCLGARVECAFESATALLARL